MKLLEHARRNAIAYTALFLAAGGGGYAIAATNHNTIKACADAHTGTLHVQRRCHRGQRRITWNQQGPQGTQGRAGPTGPPAAAAWAIVTDPGTVLSGRGISVQHASAGTYQVTVTAAGCAQGFNAPVASVSDGNPPAGQAAGGFPVAWVGDTGTNQQFKVFTGVVVGGTFTPTDHSFNLQDSCS
jgi:hypothetical protein